MSGRFGSRYIGPHNSLFLDSLRTDRYDCPSGYAAFVGGDV